MEGRVRHKEKKKCKRAQKNIYIHICNLNTLLSHENRINDTGQETGHLRLSS